MRGKGQAKNGDKLFWEEKFHATNGKAQTYIECALHFFLLSLGGEGFKGGYFSVFLNSHYVDHPTIRSHWLAKNGDKLIWEEKFHVANGKAQAYTECALHFFLLSLGGEGFKGGYFSVFPGSHYVDHPTIRSLWSAKNGDKLFWEEKFHAANGKAQTHTKCALHFFLLNLGGEGFRRGYFSVFPSSHYVNHPTIRSLWLGPQGKGGWGGSSQS